MGKLFGQIANGAVFEAKVMASPQRVAWLKANGRYYPPPHVVRALVDTGASSSCVDVGVVSSLGLDPSGSASVHTPSTMGLAVYKLTYDACVVFGDGKPDPRTYVLDLIETDLASQGFELLIGRDILARCVLNYDGPNGIFSIAF
jgi:hypothetical protein